LPLQLAGAFLALFVILVVFISQSNLSPAELQRVLRDQNHLQQIVQSYPGLNLGIIMSVFLIGSLTLILIRLGSQRRRAMPVSFPSLWYVVLTFLWVVPLSILSGQLALLANLGWEEITTILPGLKSLDDLNLMEQLGEIVEGMPPWQIYLFIAVFPAVTEELLFRILIGRGLVARYGVVAGITLTTLLFASVHLHPVHMVGLIPLSVAIHISYLSSRSIWIPMLAHYLNNALAVTFLLTTLRPHAEPLPAKALGEDEFLPWWLTLAALLSAISIGLVYWDSRVLRLRLTDSQEEIEREPFVSADRGPLTPSEQYARCSPSYKYYVALVLTLLFFGISLVVHLRNIRG
jgi:hypothetical protein